MVSTFLLTLAAAVAPPALADREPPSGLPLDGYGRERYSSGAAITFDNDLFQSSDRDFDYTAGVALTLAGRRAAEYPFSLDQIAGWLDPLVPSARSGRASTLHAMQLGLLAFTPKDLSRADPIHDDRPYASLAFLTNERTFVADAAAPVYETSFTFGVLGLDLAKAIQHRLHDGLSLDELPQGWDHQIADGGEPTFRFTWARQALLAPAPGAHGLELKWRVEGSVGYLSEASIAFAGRWGRIHSPWWSFTPERAGYVSQPSPVMSTEGGRGARELYIWTGIKLRRRLYNVFLQGQFRDSAVEFSSDAVESWGIDAWLGITWQLSARLAASYVLRYQTPELKEGAGSRDLRWAGFIVSRTL